MVKNLKLIILAFGIGTSSMLFSQQKAVSKKTLLVNRYEFFLNAGATQFTGDLGGRNQPGKDYSLADINIASTSYNCQFGYRYLFHPFFSTSTIVGYGKLKGNDALTNEIVRKSRNLNFQSSIYSLEQRIEFIILSNDIGVIRSDGKFHYRFYAYSGSGITFFNPKGELNGVKYSLRPLSTEGQGLGGAKPYKICTVVIPFGFGFRFNLNKYWRLGIETTYYKTFTDYLDDVSGTYFDPSKLDSPIAQHFANPCKNNQNWFAPGQQRGDSNKDAYYTFNVQITKRLSYLAFSKNGYKFTRNSYKF